MARRVIGLDIGTYSVKVAHLEARTRASGFDIHAYSEIPLSRFVKVGQEQSEQDLQNAALSELKKSGKLDGAWIVTGLPSTFAQIRSLDVPFVDTKKIEAVLPGLMDSHLPFSVDNLTYTWFPVGDKPVGAHLLVGFARKEVVSQHLAQLEITDIDPRLVTIKAAALYDLIAQTHPGESQSQGLYGVIDIGHKTTGICVGDKKSIRFARSVPKGGHHVTQSLSDQGGISFEQAEKKKLEAHEMTDSIREAYYPIAREIRQTLLAMESETHTKVEQVYLVGGGSKTAGLAEFLSTLLMTNVSLVNRFSGFANLTALTSAPGPEAGLAVSYALLGEQVAHKVPRFNFRRDEFAFSGELGFVRKRAVTLAVFTCLLVILLGFTGWLSNYLLALELQSLSQRHEQDCPAGTANQKMDPATCLEAMTKELNAKLPVPDASAADVLLDLSAVIPASLDLKLKALSIDPKQLIALSAETSAPEVVDELAGILKGSKCFDQIVKKGNRGMPNGVVTFDLEMKYNCRKVKEAPRAAPQASKEK
jgi:type IV pilus assembly protein PilM